VVIVAGPDVGGRRAVVEALRGSPERRVEQLAWRPLGRPFPTLAGSAVSVVGDLVKFLRARRVARRSDATVVLDAAWHDAVLDPARFGLHPRVIGPSLLLWHLAPRADVVVVVDREPGRRARPGPESADWGAWSWHELSGWIAHRVIVDSVLSDSDAARVARRAFAAVDGADDAPPPLRWLRIPSVRRGVLTTSGTTALPALAMHRGATVRSNLAAGAKAVLAAAHAGLPAAPPLDGLPDLLADIGVAVDGAVAVQATGRGRVTIGVSGLGRLQAVLKTGPLDDAGLRHEAEALAVLAGGGDAVVTPRLRWAGEWCGRFVIVTDAIASSGVPRWVDPAVAADICVVLHRGGTWGQPVVHGDLAGWNLLRPDQGWAVVDWENARFEIDPMWDLAHFVVQQGAHVGGYDPRGAVAHLVAPGSAGVRYLSAVGIDPSRAAQLLGAWLRRTPVRGRYVRGVAQELLAAAPARA
jgi:hypothetical protein